MRRLDMGFIKWIAVALLTVSAAMVSAANTASDPYKKIEEVTVELLNIIAAHRDSYPETEAAYFDRLDQLLAAHVDFGFIARNVMGSYGRSSSPKQRALFARTFRDGLVETYGRGLIGYENQKIVLLPTEPLVKGQRKVTVKQEIRSADNVYPLEYTLFRSKKTGEWMVVNVVINGINLGKTFRNQFMQSAQRSGGNIDKVISGWLTSAE
jgi:phospholipid transport system substrate-binding protein